jgi:hypothetical protein
VWLARLRFSTRRRRAIANACDAHPQQHRQHFGRAAALSSNGRHDGQVGSKQPSKA